MIGSSGRNNHWIETNSSTFTCIHQWEHLVPGQSKSIHEKLSKSLFFFKRSHFFLLWLCPLEKITIGSSRIRRLLLASINENIWFRVRVNPFTKNSQNPFFFLKDPIFVCYDWVLWKKQPLDWDEFVDFYLHPSMRTSGSGSE